MAEQRFQGTSIGTLPRPSRRYPPGRVCAAKGCATKLSVYNRWGYCWQHEPEHTFIHRGRGGSRSVA